MALEQPPGVLNTESTDSSVQRHTTAALAGDREGVCGASDFTVAQSSTPGMSVSVAAGYALVKGSTTSYQGMYSVHNDASIDAVAISPGDPTNPRRDIVGLLIRDGDYSGSDYDVQVHVVEGTPAGSPADPTLPDSFLALARVQVDANESTSIVNADITDLRVFTGDYDLRRTMNLSATSTSLTFNATNASGSGCAVRVPMGDSGQYLVLVYGSVTNAKGSNWSQHDLLFAIPAGYRGTSGFVGFTNISANTVGRLAAEVNGEVTFQGGTVANTNVVVFNFGYLGTA